KTKRQVISIQVTLSIVWGPAGFVLKQTDRTDAMLIAQVEPVERAARNTNQIARGHFNGYYFVSLECGDLSPLWFLLRCAGEITLRQVAYGKSADRSAHSKVNMKDSPAGDDESNFILVVPVFFIEFCEHL